MELLKMLQTLRNPALDAILSVITRLGEETALMVAGMAILWCVSKKWGFRLMFAGLSGNVLNQLLKAIFLIPRPWILDPTFTIVESAREAATGYSFPSGHTQTAASVFGTLSVWAKQKWLKIACIAAVALVGFSRMYLGVHTPLDVSVSLFTGALTVAGMLWLMNLAESSAKGAAAFTAGMLAFAALLVGYVLLAPVREANIPEFDAHGVKNAWTLLGTMAGMLAAWWYDRTRLHFETKAVWWAQIAKLAIGLGLVMAVRIGMKPVLSLIFGDAVFTSAIRYFLMCVMGGVVWPMTFGWWSRLGKKTSVSA